MRRLNNHAPKRIAKKRPTPKLQTSVCGPLVPHAIDRGHVHTVGHGMGSLNQLPRLVLAGTAFLLVSTLPVWSFKNFKVPQEYGLPLLLGAVTFAAVLVADPWAALAAAGLIYLAMLPFSVRSFRRLRHEAEEMREELP